MKNEVLDLNSKAMSLWMRLIVFVGYSDMHGMQPLKNVLRKNYYSGKSCWESVISHLNQNMSGRREFGKAGREKPEMKFFRFFPFSFDFLSFFLLKNQIFAKFPS